MRIVVSLTTALALLAHAILGCCSHHDHGREIISAEYRAQHPAHECCHSHGEHDDGEDSGTPELPAPCSEKQCDGSDCSFMAASKHERAQAKTDTPLPVAEPRNHSVDRDRALVAIVDTGGLIEPPLRLHLLNQVLLI